MNSMIMMNKTEKLYKDIDQSYCIKLNKVFNMFEPVVFCL